MNPNLRQTSMQPVNPGGTTAYHLVASRRSVHLYHPLEAAMKHWITTVAFALFSLSFAACGDGDTQPSGTDTGSSWDESEPSQGELSGDLSAPTKLTFALGDNVVIGGSTPGDTEECIQGPEGPPAPYYPGHEPYTDAITFTLAEGQVLTKIVVEELEVEAVHSVCDTPLESQLGAFTGLAASDQIDWNSDTFENFVKLPEAHPLIGAGFAKTEGSDLLASYQAGFAFGPYSIDALAELPTNGTYTFWWKEGANKTSYRLNFVVTAE